MPHHLIDVLEPHEEYSLAQYLAAAQATVAEIRERGPRGALRRRHAALPEGPAARHLPGPAGRLGRFAGSLQEEAGRHDPGWLHRRLAEVDPAAAARLHPNDARRLIRALEVFEKTGRPISELQRQFDVGRPAEECRVFVLDWPKEELHARIDRRVDAMFAAGLVDEVRGLLVGPAASRLSKTASQAVGYREVIEHLEGRRGAAGDHRSWSRPTRGNSPSGRAPGSAA